MINDESIINEIISYTFKKGQHTETWKVIV